MKKLVIKQLQLCSLKEKKAKTVNLNPGKNLIIGENDTGKSCLVKSFYHAFGAEVKFEQAWKSAEVKSLITFMVDDETFSILRDEKTFSVFNSNHEHIRTFTSVGKGLAPYLAQLFDFNLRLASKSSEDAIPTPAFMFLPFYIDQDKGWNKSFDSFEQLQQFSDYRRATVEFHVGIRPNEYYTTKLLVKEKKGQLESVGTELNTIEQIILRHRDRYKEVPFDLDFESFKKEIEELLVKANHLLTEEAKFRTNLRELYDEKHSLSHQQNALTLASKASQADFNFSVEKYDNEVSCPICHTTFDNDFSDRIEIAKDIDELDVLLSEVQGKQIEVDGKIKTLKQKSEPIQSELAVINGILSEKRKTVQLADIIKAEGRRELIDDLKAQRSNYSSNIELIKNEIEVLNDRLKSYSNKEHTKNVEDAYLLSIKRYINALDVQNFPEDSYRKVTSIVEKSGSDKPRALLAYFFGIFEAITKYSTFMVCPLVIDSPNQQAQDKKNIKNILQVIRDQAPGTSQIILATEGLHGVTFDWNTIKLSTKYSVLEKESYDSVSELFKKLMAARVTE